MAAGSAQAATDPISKAQIIHKNSIFFMFVSSLIDKLQKAWLYSCASCLSRCSTRPLSVSCGGIYEFFDNYQPCYSCLCEVYAKWMNIYADSSNANNDDWFVDSSFHVLLGNKFHNLNMYLTLRFISKRMRKKETD